MTTGKTDEPDYANGGKLPTIKEMSGLIHFGGRVVFQDEEQIVLTPEEYEQWKSEAEQKK